MEFLKKWFGKKQEIRPDELTAPVVFYNGVSYFLERDSSNEGTFLGGPPPCAIRGASHGPRQFHHLLSLNGDSVEPLWHIVGLSEIPLFYGMCFEACELQYRFDRQGIEVLKIRPSKSDPTWPYSDYPSQLPYVPLRLKGSMECSLEEFSPLCFQPLDVSESNLVVIFPNMQDLGVLLFGPDAFDLQIVFEVDIENRIVSAFIHCG